MANSFRIEPLLIDFEIGATKKIRWELLDRKTDGLGGGGNMKMEEDMKAEEDEGIAVV